MIFDKKGTTTTVIQEHISLEEFVKNLNASYTKIEHDNIIINLFSFGELAADQILEFLELSVRHRNSGKSFVVVSSDVSYEDVPEDICLVPTLQEARDFIAMEEIERELGL